MIQQVKQSTWTDETGKEVPILYITPIMRVRERNAGRILKQALQVNKQLVTFKEHVTELCNQVYAMAMEQVAARKDGKEPGKGNFTWYNFDRTIRIEVSINERIDFDDLTLQLCKSKLDAFLSENLDSKMEFVKELVTDAFSTTRGKTDSKKVMSLIRYRSKIKHPLFLEALDLLEESIRRPDSKTYFRVWQRLDNGEYELVDLNFSSI